MNKSKANLLKPLLLAVSVVVFTIVRLNKFRTGKKSEKNLKKVLTNTFHCDIIKKLSDERTLRKTSG